MKQIIFLYCFFVGAIANAQLDSLKFVVSDIFKDEKFKTSLLFAKEDSNGDIYTVRNYYSSISNPKGYYIERYDKGLKLIKRTTVEVNRNEIKGLFLTENSVILLQFQYNYKEKEYAFATLTALKEDFDFIENKIYSLDRNRLDKYDHFGIRSEPEYNFHHRNNLGAILASDNGDYLTLNLFTKSKNGDVLLVITFNKNFEKVYEYEFENIISLKETGNKKLSLEYQNMVLDNNGTVYFLGRVFNSDALELEKNDAPNYYFVLFKADAISKTQTLLPLESNNIIRSLQLVTKQDKLAAVGLYTENGTERFFELSGTATKYDGVVMLNLDKKSSLKLSESFQPFTEEFMMEKYGKVKENINSFLSYRNIYMWENGDIVLNAEEYSIGTTDNTIHTQQVYGDIISCRLNNNGTLVWAKNINKKQKAWSLDNIPFFSYSATFKNNVSYYFVNAASDLKLLKNNEMEFMEGPRLYSLKIDEVGSLSYEKVLYPKIFNTHLKVRFGILINNTDLLFEAESDNKPLMVKLFLK